MICAQVEAHGRQIAEEMERLVAMETEENRGALAELRGLVAMNEDLKRQEQAFRQHCKVGGA